MQILIDADVICFTSSLAGETKTSWGFEEISEAIDGIQIPKEITTISYDLEKAKVIMGFKVAHVVAKVRQYMEWQGDYKVTMCLSDKVNFRKTLYPEYKANRTTPKPQLYKEVREHCEASYNCKVMETLEADDVLGIIGSSLDNTVVCSIDKDMSTIQNTVFYNWKRDTFEHTTPKSAQYAHFYQCLIGDSVDNYSGCKGIGPVKAKAALDAECSWNSVVTTYESKGQTEKQALLMARIAKILTVDEYVDGKIILWTPTDSLCPTLYHFVTRFRKLN